MEAFFSRLKFLSKNTDLAVALCLVLVLGVMIIPIGPFFMDISIALVFAISIVILLMSVYAKRPLEFSTFPSVLLIITLFRLSLNVASTRNILLHGGSEGTGAAGKIIDSFGQFVLGGNYAVGIIIFTILVIINFIVITKGAGRVAEVAARFTLDAMPGKQMAIDADLNAGLIDEKEARRRRQEVSREADFYGSMDGASKFVRGDAIASIVITVVNIIGGIIVGVAQSGMTFSNAAKTFTLLTVGEGLVSQIPGIIISVAAGIIATRNASEDSLGEQISDQFSLNPKVLYIVSFVMVLFALIPNFPSLIFLALAGSVGYVAYYIENNQKNAAKEKIRKEKIEEKKPEDLESLLSLEAVELEIGYGLVSIVDAEQKGDLLERITQIRKQFVMDWGVIVPSVRIRDNLELKSGGYSIKIKGIQVATGELFPDHFLAMDPGTVFEKIDGIETVEPVFGLAAMWIPESEKDEAQYRGYTVVDVSTILATHLTEILKTNLSELFGREELVKVLDNLKKDSPKVVNDLIPDILAFGVVLKVLQNLLREGVSIRDTKTILEALADAGMGTKDPEQLTEFSRQALYRTITEKIKSANGDIPLFTLDRKLEESLVSSIAKGDKFSELNLDAKTTQNILTSLNQKIQEATEAGEKMIILCSPVIRRHFKRLTEKFIPNLIVVSHNELSSDAQIRSLGTVRL
jgi:flagellar biosynthesis protein FlhA